MPYLFDSSAIFLIVKSGEIQKLAGNLTIALAKYEIGNIVWKEVSLFKRIDEREAERLVESSAKVLHMMTTLDIRGHEKGILNLASKFHISYYDASYVYYAYLTKSELVTADDRLSKRVGAYITIKTFDNV